MSTEKTPRDAPVQDYRYRNATRKNIPPAGLAAQGRVQETPKVRYAYDPHLPPVLRFDQKAQAEQLLEKAARQALAPEEVQALAALLEQREPWLEWTGKREQKACEIDPVALHIHERVSAQAILRVAARQDIPRTLFADPEQEYRDAVQFYQHDVAWANRLILGDSLQVMASLAKREDLAGKVQMIYMDPPYGIKFASNFQSEIGKRDVKDKPEDLTREPETVKAYRDTWTLGIHSYLSYLRDRLTAAKELLTDSGSIFVQISDEHLHRLRLLMDEVFGAENFISLITFTKTTSATTELIAPTADYILWFAKNCEEVKYSQLYADKEVGSTGASKYTTILLPNGSTRPLSKEEAEDINSLPDGARIFTTGGLTSQRPPGSFPVDYQGQTFGPGTGYWKTGEGGFQRILEAGRVAVSGNRLRYVRFFDDFTVFPFTNVWVDIGGIQSRADPKVYVVQTATEAIKRCILMTTDPGDLVLDPTCLRKGTRIITEHGLKPVEDVHVGDKVLAHSGRYLPVLNTMSRPYNGKMVGIKRKGHHATIWVTEDHPVLAVRTQRCRDERTCHAVSKCRLHRNKRYLDCSQPKQQYYEEWLKAGDLAPTDYVVCNAPIGSDAELSPEIAYLIGLYLAEGFLSENSVCFCFHEEEHHLIKAVQQLMQCLFGCAEGKRFNLRDTGRAYKIRFHSRAAVHFFTQFGRGAINKRIPMWVMQTPLDAQAELIRGYFDGDGNTYEDGFRSGSVSPHLSDAICRLLWRQGIVATIGRNEVHPGPNSFPSKYPMIIVSVHGENRKLMAEILKRSTQNPNPSYQQNKIGWLRNEGRLWAKIDTIQVETSQEDVFNLTVAEDNSYATEICTVHNCGSGSTAYVAEQWGRRWITIDSSRVPLAIARQRLLTAKFDYYTLKDSEAGRKQQGLLDAPEPPQGDIRKGFCCKTVPHITLKSIAQNTALDPIFAKGEPVLAEKLDALNRCLQTEVTPELRSSLRLKLAAKEKREGKKAITDADRRRWILPESAWQEWEVPFDSDPDWPPALQSHLEAYREAWRAKMNAVNAVIAASAEQEELVDRPLVEKSILRVSGPFTVEGVMPVEETIDLESPIESLEDELETFSPAEEDLAVVNAAVLEPPAAVNADAYHARMLQLLRADGVRFPDNKVMKFTRLEPLSGGLLHAEGEWGEGGDSPCVAVVFGPQVGPLTAQMVEDCLITAHRKRIYTDIVFAAFAFDAAAQAIIQDDPNPRVRCHLAHIRPDVQMGDLLKTTNNSQLFTVFGLPRVEKTRLPNGEWMVEMQGVDIYDPVEATLRSTKAEKVAAWFLDADFDGACFCITQAFFPDPKAWEKLSKALANVVDPDRFAAFSGTHSLPFPAGKHKRAAVKVIDPRGNEVLRVVNLMDEVTY